MHSPPENFELLILRNAISGVLRRQFLSKMFTKSIVILCLFLFAWFQVQVLDFIIFILFCAIFKVFWTSVSVKYNLLCVLVKVS